MLPPNPLCIFEMYRFTKSCWRTRPSIWIPRFYPHPHDSPAALSAPAASLRSAQIPTQPKQTGQREAHSPYKAHGA